jgi:hypothetical protein
MDELEFMNQPIQQYQQSIASYMGKLLRDHFGKGPESVAVSVSDCYIVMYSAIFLRRRSGYCLSRIRST